MPTFEKLQKESGRPTTPEERAEARALDAINDERAPAPADLAMASAAQRSGQSIPDAVLDRIIAHRPHLATLAKNLRAHPGQAQQIETAIADAYLQAEPQLSGPEIWRLSACSAGRRYGQSCGAD